MKIKKEELLKMKIGDEKWNGSNGVMRVYNGWIYLFHDQVSDTITSSVFVPKSFQTICTNSKTIST